MRGTSEFDEWFLLQPSAAGWLGPVLALNEGVRQSWAAYWNMTWMRSFKGQPAKGWFPPGWLGPALGCDAQHSSGAGPLVWSKQ